MHRITHWCQYEGSGWTCVTQSLHIIFWNRNTEFSQKTCSTWSDPWLSWSCKYVLHRLICKSAEEQTDRTRLRRASKKLTGSYYKENPPALPGCIPKIVCQIFGGAYLLKQRVCDYCSIPTHSHILHVRLPCPPSAKWFTIWLIMCIRHCTREQVLAGRCNSWLCAHSPHAWQHCLSSNLVLGPIHNFTK